MARKKWSNDDFFNSAPDGEESEEQETTDGPVVKDANGTVLRDGDTVVLIKDLKVKGAGSTLKRGTTVKNIRLTDDPHEIDCRTSNIKGLVLRTEFVKKVLSDQLLCLHA